MTIEVRELGGMDYLRALELQRRMVSERAQGRIPDALLLTEHPDVITCGTSCRNHALRDAPYPVHRIERGGDATYHGPGQLVGYPILHLGERGLLVGTYLRELERTLIEAASEFGLQARAFRGFTGVWCGGKKIASIGVAVKSWVCFHGFALNVSTVLSRFQGLRPCGLEPERMGSMESLLGGAVDMPAVRSAVARAFLRRFARSGGRFPDTAQPGPLALCEGTPNTGSSRG